MSEEKKKDFKKFLRSVFVDNWQYKLFAIISGVFFWFLVVGLL